MQPDQDVDEDFVQPPADAYQAVIEMDRTKYHFRASKVNKWEVPQHSSNFCISFVDLHSQLYPRAATNRLDVLYHHLYCEPDEKDANQPAFTIQTSHVMAVIDDHENIQVDQERSKKRGALEEAHAITVKIEWLKKRACCV